MHKVDAYNYLTIVKYEQIVLIIRIFFITGILLFRGGAEVKHYSKPS